MDFSTPISTSDQASQPEEAPHYGEALQLNRASQREGPPPPPPPAYGAAETTFAIAQPSSSHVEGRVLPLRWNVYSKDTSAELFIGENQQTPLYSVTRSEKSGWKSRHVIVYNGVSTMNPILASGRYKDSVGDTWQINLPPTPSHSTGTVETVSKSGWNRNVFRFSVETEIASQQESFEWRMSSNSHLSSILCSHVLGWKLVRMTNDIFTADLSGAPGEKSSWPMTSDGKEIVAVCAMCARNGALSTKYWTHAFLGTGKSSILGKSWEVMAVMTSLMLMDYQSDREAYNWQHDRVT